MRATRVVSLLFAAAALIAAAGSAAAGAAGAGGAAQNVDLEAFPRVDLDDLPERHRVWLQEEVVWIITRDEREVFLRLSSDAERDRFIEEFWRNRDPSPGTEKNEYRELHAERLRFANLQFGRETPRQGWQTDRGRIFILLGEPRTISRMPNSQEAVPAEVWFYAVDPALGVPPFFYVIFFKDSGVGEYRLWSPSLDGPEKLLNPSGQMALQRGDTFAPGAQQFGSGPAAQALAMLRRVDQELGNAAASLIPGEGSDFGNSPLRSEMVLSQIFGLPDRLMPNATWAYNVLTGVTESRVRFETLPLQAQAVVLRDPSGAPFVHLVTRTPGHELNLNDFQDRYYLTFQVSTGLRDARLRFLSDAEPRVLQADLDEERAREVRNGDVQYMERLPVVAGEYVLDLVMENNVTGEFGRLEIPLTVPEAGQMGSFTSAPFLVLEAQDMGAAYDPFTAHFPFQVGSRVVVPALDGPFPTDGVLQVFWQLGLGQDRVAPALATYEVQDAEGRVRISRALRIDPRRDDGESLDHLAEIDLTGLPAGAYTLVADVEDDSRPADRLPFRIADPDAWKRPFVHALRQPPPESPAVKLARARQLRTVGRTSDAIAELADALRRAPELQEALDLQVELLTDAARFQELEALLAPRLVERPNDARLLLILAEVKARQGEHYDAIRYYERARLGGAEETPDLLNALASEYYAEGQLQRTRELIERSLELDPDQPQMRRLLDELLQDS